MRGRATLGDRLQAALELRGLTQGQLASKAKVRQGSISMIISGERKNPQVETLAALARALDVSVDWLLGLPKRDADALDPEETQLLFLWRQLPTPAARRFVLHLLEARLAEERADRQD